MQNRTGRVRDLLQQVVDEHEKDHGHECDEEVVPHIALSIRHQQSLVVQDEGSAQADPSVA